MPVSTQILPTFLDSWVDNRFSRSDQGRIRNTIKRIQEDFSHPGLSSERLQRVRDRNFWSVKVNNNIRVILYRRGENNLLCYVGPHDDAYNWAERRTAAAVTENAIALVEDEAISDGAIISEEEPVDVEDEPIEDVVVDEDQPQDFVFLPYTDDQLIDFGIPELFVQELRDVSSADEFLELAVQANLSSDVFDNLYEVFEGGEPISLVGGQDNAKPSRNIQIARTVVLKDNTALQSILEQPWERWLIFLDPEQLECVEQNRSGPAKVFGSAGTGKTVVALHRAAYLAKNTNIRDNRIHLLTFSKTLAGDLKDKLELLVGEGTPESARINVSDFESFAVKVYSEIHSVSNYIVAEEILIKDTLEKVIENLRLGDRFTKEFAYREYMSVIGPWGLNNIDDYLEFSRRGRGVPMRPNERKSFWPIIEELIIELGRKNRISRFKIFHDVADHLENNNNKRADHVIIDECQDIGPEILRMVRAMVDKTDNDIFMCGDLGQSLYHRHHSWLQHGIDVRGRSSVLRINYRTSRQIKDTADCLTNLRAITGDEEDEDRRSVSIFDGPSPILQLFDNQDAESDGAAQWISQQLSDGIEPHDLLVITRSSLQQRRAKTAVDRALELAGIENSGLWSLDAENNFHDGLVGYSSTERSKGLEYKAIAILACDEDLMPLLSNKKNFLDEEEEREWMELERNQLYVAMTRARDRLYISGIKPGSAFLRELGTLDT